MKNSLYILMILIIFWGCDKNLEIPVNLTEPQLVVNCVFNPDSLWKLDISESKYISSPSQIRMIDDASISIRSNTGEQVSLINMGDGIYSSAYEKPEIGKDYIIDVYHANYESVHSTASVPQRPTIRGIRIDTNIVMFGIKYRKITITFDDGPLEDFYMVRMRGDTPYYIYSQDTTETIIDTIDRTVVMVIPTYEQILNREYGSFSYVTDDLLLQPTSNELVFMVYDEYFFDSGIWRISHGQMRTLYVELSRISKEFYLYQKTYWKFLSTQYSMYQQPTQVMTNIENGLGLFTGYSSDCDSLQIEP